MQGGKGGENRMFALRAREEPHSFPCACGAHRLPPIGGNIVYGDGRNIVFAKRNIVLCPQRNEVSLLSQGKRG